MKQNEQIDQYTARHVLLAVVAFVVVAMVASVVAALQAGN